MPDFSALIENVSGMPDTYRLVFFNVDCLIGPSRTFWVFREFLGKFRGIRLFNHSRRFRRRGLISSHGRLTWDPGQLLRYFGQF